jgi:hypothetical protein
MPKEHSVSFGARKENKQLNWLCLKIVLKGGRGEEEERGSDGGLVVLILSPKLACFGFFTNKSLRLPVINYMIYIKYGSTRKV